MAMVADAAAIVVAGSVVIHRTVLHHGPMSVAGGSQ